jgi:DNA-binding NtrC family response regulator
LDKKRILIVDDDKSLLKNLVEILQREGYDVDTAETGQKSIERSKTQFYNLALIDIRLPDMDGTQLLRLIDGHIPRTMKIIITGYPSIENAIESLNLRADAYIVKPVDVERLLKTIDEKLKEQNETAEVTEEKVARWIETRVKQL